jgi:hypothetical protein
VADDRRLTGLSDLGVSIPTVGSGRPPSLIPGLTTPGSRSARAVGAMARPAHRPPLPVRAGFAVIGLAVLLFNAC